MTKFKATGRVLLFSGGMDSFIAAKLWKPRVLLYAAMGHRYEKRELETIARTGLTVTIDERLHLGDLERDDAIIPLRNLYLIAMASHYGASIGLGALKGEVNPDKSPRFRRQMQAVLNTCYAPSYWSAGSKFTVVYPVARWTKRQLISQYLRHGGRASHLIERTRSCYEATALPCGHCSACIKRHIALKLNGIEERTEYDPHTSPYLAAMRRRLHTFDAERLRETLAVFPQLEARR